MSTDSGSGATNGLKEKQVYGQLTDKQKAAVDAIVENPDATRAKMADIAGCSEGYIYTVLDSFPHIIEERETVVNNQHDTVEKGNVRVEGDIDFSDLEEHPKPQTVQERPVKNPSGSEPSIDDFLPEATCDRLEAIAEDISPVWLDRKATVEETIQALAADYTPSEGHNPKL